MLPGKTYTPEDVLRIGRKRIWVLLLPLSIVAAGTAVWARMLPDLYLSETSILVVPQRVPESYVRSTVTTRIEDRLGAMTAQILSRTRLERIIDEFNLYEEQRKTMPMQDVVELMQRNIHPEVLRGDAFRIRYIGREPRTVMQVTERLATLFINENLEDRSRMAEGTNQFLEGQLEDAKRRLIEQEKRLEDYRRRYAGQLPEQLESNLQVLRSAQMQLQQVADDLNRERDHQLRLERDVADMEQQIQQSEAAAAAGGPDGSTLAQQLQMARDVLATARLTKLDTHPDVRRMKAAIAELEARLAVEPEDTGPSEPRVLSPADAARRKRLEDLKLDLALTKRNIAGAEREQARLQKDIAAYQARNEAIPTRQTEMVELLRDYATLQTLYTDLLANCEESKMAASLENRQIGEQFKVLDTARIAERPFSPDRQRLNLMGLAGGLTLGLLLVGFLEYRDNSFRTDAEVARILALPVLATVPLMQSAAEQKRARRNQILAGVGFGATVLGCLAVVVYSMVR